MPCRGCGKDEIPPGLTGRFEMKFIGYVDGQLINQAPGGYEQNKVYMMPIRQAKYPWWELVEPIPKLRVPEASEEDSVFEDEIFVPDEEFAEEEAPLEDSGET